MGAMPTQRPRFFSYCIVPIVHSIIFLPFFSCGAEESDKNIMNPFIFQTVFSLCCHGQGLKGNLAYIPVGGKKMGRRLRMMAVGMAQKILTDHLN